MAFAIDKTQNAAEAEELVQETFTRFWKILPEYETTGSIKNFEAKIETLDEQDRIIFRLYFIDGLSYAEIAKQLKMKLSTVHGRIIRLRKMFKEVGKEIDKKEI